MDTCLNCGKDLKQIPQKRKKQFCNSTCRSNYWQKEKRRSNPVTKIQDQTKPTNVVKHPEQPKTNYSINTEIDKEEKKHKLWKEGDPTEGSNAFYLRYGSRTYDEIEK